MAPVRVTTRCRADLAGGTLDIWPLGLLHPGARTVNVAVDLAVTVELEPAPHWTVVQSGERLAAESLERLARQPGAELFALVASELGLEPSEARITSASPRGAGLGASSALTVALLAAGELVLGGELTMGAGERAACARDLEARLMQLPTGRQDHFPAQLGGALVLEHRAGGERWQRLDADLEALAAHLLVAYTGRSHFSAGNNWEVVRRRLDGEPVVTARLEAIREAADRAEVALRSGDWLELGSAMDADWRSRRGLAPGISTPEIEALLAAAAELGGFGGKACGAGGGGCVAALVPPGRRGEVEGAWRRLGARVLDAPPTARGLETETGER
ncbi:MAG TPA: hypothetical protein VLA66_07480 [Thermoanaerobaculia bacterium]|nr:hypothetical protein [Thermoanaerobaculia bacterium]